jgi:hypothetical protein
MAGGLSTDGKAELRMNTFAACGFEMNPAKMESRKLDHCDWIRSAGQGTVRRLFIRSSALPSVGITARTHFVACRLKAFGVSVDRTIWTLGLTKVKVRGIWNTNLR